VDPLKFWPKTPDVENLEHFLKNAFPRFKATFGQLGGPLGIFEESKISNSLAAHPIPHQCFPIPSHQERDKHYSLKRQNPPKVRSKKRKEIKRDK
jgi:hypothetical protein